MNKGRKKKFEKREGFRINKKEQKRKSLGFFFSKKKMEPPNVGYWVLIIFAILITLAVFAIMLWYAISAKKTTVGPNPAVFSDNITIPNGMNQAYAQGDGTIIVSNTKPFVVTVPQKFNTKNAFMFSYISINDELTNTSRAFTFEVNKAVTVMSLQVIDNFFDTGGREVGIYNLTTRALLFRNVVSKSTDGLVGPFRSYALLASQQFQLDVGNVYACVALVMNGDSYAPPDSSYCLPTRDLTLTGIGSVVSSVLTLPSTFEARSNNSPFASFQYQIVPTGPEVAFQMSGQYALFPPHFITGLNFEIKALDITTTKGACASLYGQDNIVLQQDQAGFIIGTPFELNTWYAVYAAMNPTNGALATVFSQNYPELPLADNAGYTISRRIGFVRYQTASPGFQPMIQRGLETNRVYTIDDPDQVWGIIATFSGDNTVVLSPVCPTATLCTLQVEMLAPNQLIGPTSLIFNDRYSLYFAPNQTYQILTLRLPLDTSLVPRQMYVHANVDPSYAGPPPNFKIHVIDFTEDI